MTTGLIGAMKKFTEKRKQGKVSIQEVFNELLSIVKTVQDGMQLHSPQPKDQQWVNLSWTGADPTNVPFPV